MTLLPVTTGFSDSVIIYEKVSSTDFLSLETTGSLLSPCSYCVMERAWPMA